MHHKDVIYQEDRDTEETWLRTNMEKLQGLNKNDGMDISIREELHIPNTNCKTLKDKTSRKIKCCCSEKTFSPLLARGKSLFLFAGECKKVFQNTNLVFLPNQLLRRLIAVLCFYPSQKSLSQRRVFKIC